MIGDGEPGRLLGLIDDESDLWPAIQKAGRFAVQPLEEGQMQLADRFAGILPAPGGVFRQGEAWAETAYGPVVNATWAGCRLDQARQFGWGLLVEATLEQVELGPAREPLLHHRGSYRHIADR